MLAKMTAAFGRKSASTAAVAESDSHGGAAAGESVSGDAYTAHAWLRSLFPGPDHVTSSLSFSLRAAHMIVECVLFYAAYNLAAPLLGVLTSVSQAGALFTSIDHTS
jgi:hypothetical protein